VRHYFQAAGGDERAKTQVLIAKIRDFDIILTESEAEALILESILIKKHKPRYNIALKDDKTYPYLLVDRSHTFPKLIYARRFKRTKKLDAFGPYVSAGSLRRAIQFLNQSFRLRDCSDNEFTNRSRPCINYQIGTCSAPCTSMISPEAYGADLEAALKILRGKGKEVLVDLESQMEAFSAAMEYESAAKMRDQIDGLRVILLENEQNISDNSRNRLGTEDRDAVGMHRVGESACFAVVFVRGGRVIDSTNFYVKVMPEDSDSDVLFQFLAQFYLTREAMPGEIREEAQGSYIPGTELKKIPPMILLPVELGEQEQVLEESFLRLGYSAKVLTPKRGASADLLKMAEKNALDSFHVESRKLGDLYKALGELQSRLKLQNYPRRIECFDISNLGDTGIVASRVVFVEGKPEKNLYRKYKMREVTTQNDFAAMREVLTRRLSKSSRFAEDGEMEELPDLLVVDGGKGQLSMAMEVIKELDLTGLEVVALAKAKTESDFSSEEVGGTQERVFKPGRMNPIILHPGSNPCHMMQRIRDEAHRFAIAFQRKQRELK
jgi:excinuclease ABC subunit C